MEDFQSNTFYEVLRLTKLFSSREKEPVIRVKILDETAFHFVLMPFIKLQIIVLPPTMAK